MESQPLRLPRPRWASSRARRHTGEFATAIFRKIRLEGGAEATFFRKTRVESSAAPVRQETELFHPARSGAVGGVEVVDDHPPRGELRHDVANRRLHHLDPAVG